MGGYFSFTFAQAASRFDDAPASSAPIHIHELYAILVACR